MAQKHGLSASPDGSVTYRLAPMTWRARARVALGSPRAVARVLASALGMQAVAALPLIAVLRAIDVGWEGVWLALGMFFAFSVLGTLALSVTGIGWIPLSAITFSHATVHTLAPSGSRTNRGWEWVRSAHDDGASLHIVLSMGHSSLLLSPSRGTAALDRLRRMLVAHGKLNPASVRACTPTPPPKRDLSIN
jgi:hypothetical protein